MKRRTFIAVSGGTLLCVSHPLRAQGRATPRRIGHLSAFNRATVDLFLGDLRPELEKLGWTEGRNLVILEPRTAEGANERLPALAAELVSQSPDLILVQSVPAARALVKATKSIPVVMAGVGTPVELGIVADYRRPGGNVTGSSYLADELRAQVASVSEGGRSSLAKRRSVHQPEQRSCHCAGEADAGRRDCFGNPCADRRGCREGRLRVSFRRDPQMRRRNQFCSPRKR